MNNLKFRAWHKESEEMYEIISLNFGRNCKLSTINCVPKYSEEEMIFDSQEIELMQWTTWNDAQNLPIFEGDIIDCGHGDGIGRMKVQWDKDKCMFCFMWVGKPYDWHEFDEFSESDLLIVGNIYENPELLEEIECIDNKK